MVRVCAWCKTLMGFKTPLEDPSLTHGICDECAEEMRKKRIVKKGEKKQMENTKLPAKEIEYEALRLNFDVSTKDAKYYAYRAARKSYEKSIKANDNPKTERSRKAKFCTERIKSPGYFDSKSFRTKTARAHRLTFGCKKGQWDAKRKICKVPVELQRILHPAGEGKCPVGGKELRDNPGAKWHEDRYKRAKHEGLIAETPVKKALAFGKYLAHLESADVSRQMGINPKLKSSWYLGITKSGQHKPFASVLPVTRSVYGRKYKTVIGPFSSLTKVKEFRRAE